LFFTGTATGVVGKVALIPEDLPVLVHDLAVSIVLAIVLLVYLNIHAQEHLLIPLELLDLLVDHGTRESGLENWILPFLPRKTSFLRGLHVLIVDAEGAIMVNSSIFKKVTLIPDLWCIWRHFPVHCERNGRSGKGG
jgi:hypothetical protein